MKRLGKRRVFRRALRNARRDASRVVHASVSRGHEIPREETGEETRRRRLLEERTGHAVALGGFHLPIKTAGRRSVIVCAVQFIFSRVIILNHRSVRLFRRGESGNAAILQEPLSPATSGLSDVNIKSNLLTSPP